MRSRRTNRSAVAAGALALAVLGGSILPSADSAAEAAVVGVPSQTVPFAESAAWQPPTVSVSPGRSAVSAAFDTDRRTVTIGDSIMSGHGLADEDEAWPALLASSAIGTVTNLGCSGAGFIAAGSCGTDYEGLVPEAAAAHPAVVVIESSDNDGGQGAPDLDSATLTTVEAIRAALPDAEIVGLSTLWDQPGAVPSEVRQSSAALRTAVSDVGGTFIDVGQPIAGRPGLLQSDSEHPTASGQRVLAEAFAHDLQTAGIVY